MTAQTPAGVLEGLAGVRIIESPFLTETFEDWSNVRSHGRARRRMKQGHPQRVRHIQVPSKTAYYTAAGIVMHPEMAAALRARAQAPQ